MSKRTVSTKHLTRQQFLLGLIAVVGIGFWFGLETSDFFLARANIEPFGNPSTRATTLDTIFVSLSLFGTLIWPIVFGGIFGTWAAMRSKRVTRKQWELQTSARLAQQRETEQRIKKAKQSGLIQ